MIPDGYDPARPNLHALFGQRLGRLWVVHRLDKNTSGLLFFARSAEAPRRLNAQFEQHSVRKTYHLLALGELEWYNRTVSLPLRVNGDRSHRTVIGVHKGKPAHTAFTVLERFSDQVNLLAAAPTTGYAHQISAHCAALGLWLLGDPLYLPHPYPLPPDYQPPRRFTGPSAISADFAHRPARVRDGFSASGFRFVGDLAGCLPHRILPRP